MRERADVSEANDGARGGQDLDFECKSKNYTTCSMTDDEFKALQKQYEDGDKLWKVALEVFLGPFVGCAIGLVALFAIGLALKLVVWLFSLAV